jgi:hypothetical protein
LDLEMPPDPADIRLNRYPHAVVRFACARCGRWEIHLADLAERHGATASLALIFEREVAHCRRPPLDCGLHFPDMAAARAREPEPPRPPAPAPADPPKIEPHGKRRLFDQDLPFVVERFTPSGELEEVIARAGNALVARAAFNKVAELYPNGRFYLSQGIRLIAEYPAPKKSAATPPTWHLM